eukprot:6203611-Pleurochrysis_carterae.AAC.2
MNAFHCAMRTRCIQTWAQRSSDCVQPHGFLIPCCFQSSARCAATDMNQMDPQPSMRESAKRARF